MGPSTRAWRKTEIVSAAVRRPLGSGVISTKGPVNATPQETTVKLNHLSLSLSFLAFLSVTTLGAGCAEVPETTGATTNGATPGASAQPDPSSSGSATPGVVQIPNPAATYCGKLGYSLAGDQCAFPDGTECEQWSFFRGQCGSAHSYCRTVADGDLAAETVAVDGSTSQVAVCTLPGGSRCEEFTLASGKGCVAPPAAATPAVVPGGDSPGGDSPGGAGVANPAAVYCISQGFSEDGELCVFADGTSCEQWAFYRGECGAERSFCAQHGGTLSSVTEDMGSWTAQYALCTLADGTSCPESEYYQTGTCR